MNDLSKHSQENDLTVSEAEQRVWKAVDELEEIINTFNKTPGKRDEVRRADLASTLMAMLMQKYGIIPSSKGSPDDKQP